MKHVVLLMGLPYSGKSTLAGEYAARGWQIIERDAILQKVIASAEFQQRVTAELSKITPAAPEFVFEQKNKIATEMLGKRVRATILQSPSENIIYDGTNLQKSVREPILTLAREGVIVDGIFLKVPIAEIRARAIKAHLAGARIDNFNETAWHTIEYMDTIAEKPTRDEGFHSLEIREWSSESANELHSRIK